MREREHALDYTAEGSEDKLEGGIIRVPEQDCDERITTLKECSSGKL